MSRLPLSVIPPLFSLSSLLEIPEDLSPEALEKKLQGIPSCICGTM